MSRRKAAVTIAIDLDQPGKQIGAIRIAHSSDDSAYGGILIPVISIRNGSGPRILGLAGVHGDEFEGQIAWTKIARMLDTGSVRGHLVIIPALNVPATLAGRRVSPLDDVNLNRCFPGDRLGTPTQRMAHIVEHDLLPQFDSVIDIHSGGRSVLYLPGPTVTADPDPSAHAERLDLLRVFGSPVGYVFDESGGGHAALNGACRRAGVKRLGSEMGGGGGVCPVAVRQTEAGILRVLAHWGALAAGVINGLPAPSDTRLLRRGGPMSDHYLYADEAGVFEPFVDLGVSVRAGQEVGQILFPDIPWRDPLVLRTRAHGVVIARRALGCAARGDGLIVLGEDLAG